MDKETRKRLRDAKANSGEPDDEPLANTLHPPGEDELARFAADEVDCPHCAERIKAAAKVCKHCGRDVADEPEKGGKRRTSGRLAPVVHHHHHGATVTKSPGTAAVLAFLVPGLGHIYAGRIGFGLAYIFILPVGMAVVGLAGIWGAIRAGSAGGGMGAIGGIYLAAFCLYVWQIYDAHASCSASSGTPRRRRR